MNAVEVMFAGHGAAAFFPIGIDGADVAEIRGDAGDGGEEEMIFAAAGKVEGETAFGHFAEEESGIFGKGVEMRGEFAVRNVFDKKFENFFVGRGGDGVGAFDGFIAGDDAEGGVLTGFEGKVCAGIDVEEEEVVGNGTAVDDFGDMKFFGSDGQGASRLMGRTMSRYRF